MYFYHGCKCLGWEPSIKTLKKLDEEYYNKYHRHKRLDFSPGFYCTEDRDMAKYWALLGNEEISPKEFKKLKVYVRQFHMSENDYRKLNVYEIGDDNWKELVANYLKNQHEYIGDRLDEEHVRIYREQYDLMDILDALLEMVEKMEVRCNEFVDKYYKKEIESADIITSWRLDSHYCRFLDDFLSGRISEADVLKVLRIGNYGRQVCFMTEKSIEKLEEVHKDSRLITDLKYEYLELVNKKQLKFNIEYNKYLKEGNLL